MLDLYSGAGGCAYGYAAAGFDVTGVDISPQPHYPFTFMQADALEVLADTAFLAGFDAIHGSPTCQHHARVTAWRGSRDDHPDLLTPTLALLSGTDIPWIVENVPEACPPATAGLHAVWYPVRAERAPASCLHAWQLAAGYVWGRQDAGDLPKDTQQATDFADAYAARQQAYNDGNSGVGSMPNVKDAFDTWRRTGKVAG
jgi:hypothetical protein